jgi:Ribbon-helix-helix protein, copG family
MPTTVRLDAATLRLMGRLARRTGRTKSQLIRDAIQKLGESEGPDKPVQTVYDAMEHSIGCWDSGGAQLSEATGQKFKALLRARHDSPASAPRRRAGRTVKRRSGRSSP